MDHVSRLSERAKKAHALSREGRAEAGARIFIEQPWQRKILVVDDNPDISGSFRFLLRLGGAWVESACDGIKGLELAQSFRPDVVVMDIGMPGQDGYDTCRQMRKQPGGTTLAMLAITGRNSQQDIQSCLEAGFDYHLQKPVELDLLQSVIAEAMGFERVALRR